MKHQILALALTLTSATAFAAPQSYSLPALKELCAMDAGNEDEFAFEKAFADVSEFDIKEVQSISDKDLAMVNAHLVDHEYTANALTFAELKALFGPGGDQAYNDLYVITFKSKTTGRVYTHVKTYPGDNPYGLIFDNKTLKPVAHNGDGSIVLLTNNGSYSCWELDK
ncbi:hypothetical protein AB1A81_05260 [Bdellovibrio bacteriovorus]|uniref:Uncharacterized protein n=1 Tax=Bdellovibrio bacteriovorus (strain ATCC 15356 / DSM 50701 / NCIMB 9529 / HD100) TaxID=264462 RepID=Q6MNT8_BDEBA|nr:hypothetical protein [Bdellovibrio bacteriovorus]CAE79063.1 hypothetical protein predicted by Glimmer/Critica [Bdellovibrio bacteriovorus HD100]